MYKRYNQSEEKTDHVKEITDKLEAGVKDIFNNPNKENGFDPENYKKYLQFASKFHDYSFNNCFLIALQKPEATLVAGFKTWQNKFERHVMKGEKGIKILAPNPHKVWQERDKIDPATNQPVLDANGEVVKEKVSATVVSSFRTVSVFDVSQTEGKELPRELSHYTKELQGDVKDYEKFMKALEQTSPVPIEYQTLYNGSKGYFLSDGENSKVVLNTDMSEQQNVKTAIHEIAHAELHDRETGTEKDKSLTRNEKEVQAESVAYVVCQHFGIDTSDYSFSYVGGWSSGKDLKELTASMETIQKTASGLITTIEEKMKEMERTMDAPEQEADHVKEMPEQSKIELNKAPVHQQSAELLR